MMSSSKIQPTPEQMEEIIRTIPMDLEVISVDTSCNPHTVWVNYCSKVDGKKVVMYVKFNVAEVEYGEG